MAFPRVLGFEHKLLVSALAPVALCFSATVHAQSGEEVKNKTALEEVVVTARRKEESLQEVPIAINAMSDDYLRKNDITKLEDMSVHVPSLNVGVSGGGANSPIIALRGQRPSESLISVDPAVPMYFADIVLSPTQGTNLSMYDLGNVQVLKGPQGTLFGRNSTGGSVIFSPKAPGNELGGYIEAKAGDYDLRDYEGAIDLPVSERVRLRLAGKKVDRSGYQENVAANALNGKDYWDEHSEALRFSMDIDIGNNIQNRFIYDWSSNDAQARVPVPLAFNSSGIGCSFCSETQARANTDRIVSGVLYPWGGAIDEAMARQRTRHWTQIETDYDAREKVSNQIVSNTTTWDINDGLTFKNIFGYRKLEYDTQTDADGTALGIYGSWANASSVGDLFAVTYHKDQPRTYVDTEQFSDELQLLIKGLDDRLDLLIGSYFYQLQGSEVSHIQIGPEEIFRRIYPNGDVDNSAIALFSEANYSFNDLFSMTAGIRYTKDKRKIIARNIEYTASGPSCLVQDPNGSARLPLDQCERTEADDFEAVTGRLIGTLTPAAGQMYYGSISTGYRTGGFNLRGESSDQFEPFNEEEVINYEVGAKTDWDFENGVSIRANAALFIQDYDNIQKTVDAPGAGFGTITINAAKAVIQGAELDVMVIPYTGVTASISYAYINPKYKDWTLDNDTTGLSEDASNRDFEWIPMHSGSASLSYLFPFDPSYGDISIGVHYYRQSKMRAVDETDNFAFPGIDNGPLNDAIWADGYEVYDYRLDWESVFLSNFDVAAWVKNATDESYITGGLFVIDSLGWAGAVYGPPQVIGASIRYNWN